MLEVKVKMATHLHMVNAKVNAWSCTSTPALCLHDMVLNEMSLR
jgi:hypothetical protein